MDIVIHGNLTACLTLLVCLAQSCHLQIWAKQTDIPEGLGRGRGQCALSLHAEQRLTKLSLDKWVLTLANYRHGQMWDRTDVGVQILPLTCKLSRWPRDVRLDRCWCSDSIFTISQLWAKDCDSWDLALWVQISVSPMEQRTLRSWQFVLPLCALISREIRVPTSYEWLRSVEEIKWKLLIILSL